MSYEAYIWCGLMVVLSFSGSAYCFYKAFIEGVSSKQKCKHYKQAGFPHPENMVVVLRFTPYKKEEEYYTYSFAVYECNKCGKRVFSCSHLHLLSDLTCENVDKFIAYKTELSVLISKLKGDGMKTWVNKEDTK